MIICEKCDIMYVNDGDVYVETDIETKAGTKMICPAHSIIYTYDDDFDGFPIYRIQDMTYGIVGDDGQSIVGTDELDNYLSINIPLTPADIKSAGKDFSRSTIHVVQFERNPVTGMLTDCSVEQFVNGFKRQPSSIPQYRVKKHDRDSYTAADVAAEIKRLHSNWQKSGGRNEEGFEQYRMEHQRIFEGNPKAPHIHGVGHGGSRGEKGRVSIKASDIMRLLNVPFGCIYRVDDNSGKSGRGNDGFLDACIYLDHKTDKAMEDGKFIYENGFEEDDVCNFDLDAAIAEREADNAAYGMDNPTLLQKWKQDLLKGRKTLNDCYEENIDLYADNIAKLEKWRNDYLYKRAPMPALRQTFYIEAESAQGGEGKSLATKALARALAAEFGADTTKLYYELNDYIFNVNDSRVSLQHYDGQPIIVINDMKAGDMMACFGGRRGVKELLDPFQDSKASYNVKFGDCVVIAKYIIINGIQSVAEFKHDLAVKRDANDDVSEEKALRQFERRIWGGLNIIDEETIAVMFQRKLLEPTFERFRYDELCRVRCNFAKAIRKYEGETLDIVSNRMLAPLKQNIKLSEEANITSKINDPDKIDPEDLNPVILPPYYDEKVVVDEIPTSKVKAAKKAEKDAALRGLADIAKNAYENEQFGVFANTVEAYRQLQGIFGKNDSFNVLFSMKLFDSGDKIADSQMLLDADAIFKTWRKKTAEAEVVEDIEEDVYEEDEELPF